MQTTPNLGLKKWDLNSDEFNHNDLTHNWDVLDADALRARPTDRAEVLAAVPGSGNFVGRLVYLSAAHSGFQAHTLIRFDGSAWRAVGPHEIVSALPTVGNFVGRIAYLTASDSGFAANSLLMNTTGGTGGGAWQEVGRQISVLASVPGTGNFNGRVVVLSAANGGFAAWDMIVYDGAAYRLVGPAKNPPVGTNIAGLGTGAAGKLGFLQIGTTPYDFSLMSYSSSLSKWIGDEYPLITLPDTGGLATTSTAYTIVTQASAPWIPWGARDTGSVKLQVRLIVEAQNSSVSGTTSVGVAARSVNVNGTPGAFGSPFNIVSVTGTTSQLKDSAWQEINEPSNASYLSLAVHFKSDSASFTATIHNATVWMRWTS